MATTVVTGTSIKVNAAVSAQGTANGFPTPSVVVYTAPANGYAIVNMALTGDPGATVLVGNRPVYFRESTFSVPQDELQLVNSYGLWTGAIYIGPSQSIVINQPALVVGTTLYVTGVSFINSP